MVEVVLGLVVVVVRDREGSQYDNFRVKGWAHVNGWARWKH